MRKEIFKLDELQNHMMKLLCWRNFVFIFFGIILFNTASAQSEWSPDSVLTRQQMLDDLDSLKKVIIASHPNPFAYYSADQFENNFSELKISIDSTSTMRAFTSKVASLILPMRDSHTTIDFFNLHRMCFANDNYFLPINIYSSGDSILIESDWEDFIPKGSRLISINGADAMEVYRKSLEWSCIEGEAYTGQQRVADAIFPIVYAWHNTVLEENDMLVIPYGKSSQVSYFMKGYKKKEYQRLNKLRSKQPSHQAVSFKFLEGDSIALLRVATFAPANRNKYKRDIRSSFKKIKKHDCKYLVLDIRDNSGGSSGWVEYLYSFLDKTGYNTPSNVIGKNSELAMQRSKGYNKGLSKLIINIFYKNDEDVQSFNRFARLPFGASDTSYFTKPTLQKMRLVYSDKCVLLINGLTASAGVDFTNQFKRKQRGLILGEPCLGPTSGTFGNPSSYKLPNSKIRVNIATIRYNYDNSFVYEQSAIQPDVLIQATGANLFNKVDPAILYIQSNP